MNSCIAGTDPGSVNPGLAFLFQDALDQVIAEDLSSERALAKLATIGRGPPFHRAGANGRIILYIPEELDQWALTKIGKALRSTAEQ